MNKISMKFLACVMFVAGSHGSAFAAEPDKGPLSLQEIAAYQGSDRQERLVEAAKKEGELMVYHAYPQLANVMAAFTKKYGIKVKSWRSGSENILQRVASEARAKKYDVDIVQNNAPENEAAHREGLLQEVRSPFLKDLIPAASPAHKEWVGITLDVYSAAYNTAKVKKEEVPKSYRDLLDPKWKGRLGVEAEDQAWFATLVDTLGEQQGLKLFSDIVASNGISVRKGHSLLTSLVASGEVPLALSVYSWNPEQLKQKGAPVEGLLIEPVVAQFSTVAMFKKAPHPNAAALFYDFALNEGQQILADMHFVPTSKKIASPVRDVQIKFIDPGKALDMQEKWIKTYLNILDKTK
ncbi:MAG: fbpA 3 [Herminiimonas sp.]|nr:fbpA 3 [Herminiimonas sp.]